MTIYTIFFPIGHIKSRNTIKSEDKEYNEGFDAASNGIAMWENPYLRYKDSNKHNEWHTGYCDYLDTI
jgi:hypothetical protein